MKKILYIVDFNRPAKVALRYAIRVSQLFDADLDLMHVVDASDKSSTKKNAEAVLKTVVQQIGDSSPGKGLKVSTHVQIAKDQVKTITQSIEKVKCDLVVVNIGTKESADGGLSGEDLTEIAFDSGTQILAIPEKANYSKLNTALFTTDLDKFNFDLLKNPLSWIDKVNAELLLLHIYKKDKMPDDEQLENGKVLQEKLSEVKNTFYLKGNDDIIAGINKFLDEKPCQLMILIARETSLIRSIFSKSITKSLSFEANIPMFIIPEK